MWGMQYRFAKVRINSVSVCFALSACCRSVSNQLQIAIALSTFVGCFVSQKCAVCEYLMQISVRDPHWSCTKLLISFRGISVQCIRSLSLQNAELPHGEWGMWNVECGWKTIPGFSDVHKMHIIFKVGTGWRGWRGNSVSPLESNKLGICYPMRGQCTGASIRQTVETICFVFAAEWPYIRHKNSYKLIAQSVHTMDGAWKLRSQ